MKPNRGEKKIDTDRVVEYLNRAFANALYKAGGKMSEPKGSVFYDYQVDFCYLINSIQCDPAYSTPKTIQEANALIEKLENEK